MMRHFLPHARPGEVIGLLGGSFDPAHAGHAHITREALKRLRLDRVWWLVSPGNPLKSHGPAPMADRIERARAVMGGNPRVTITDIEARLGTRYTAQTLEKLTRLYPGVHFVWLMGADNLASFHRWERWQEIMGSVPVAVFARPGFRVAARSAPAARRFEDFRLRERAAGRLATSPAPAWCLINVPMMPHSSSAIRAAGGWQAEPE